MKHIKVMADYFCFPLWHEEGPEVGDIDPASLPISQELQEDLQSWADKLDATVDKAEGRNSGFKSRTERERFNHDGQALADRLQLELGTGYRVRLHAWPLLD